MNLRFWCRFIFLCGASIGLLMMVACTLEDSTPQVVYVTATSPGVAMPGTAVGAERVDLSPVPDFAPVYQTPDPPRFDLNAPQTMQHVVQTGDHLSGIAQVYGVSLDALLAVNNFENPDDLYVGQIIQLPGLPAQHTPDIKLLPDSRFVRGPGSSAFNIAEFIRQQPGYIRFANDTVRTSLANNTTQEDVLTSAQIVEQVALEYSIDPRLLLALLEYRAGWLSQPTVAEELEAYPIVSMANSGGIERSGLYHQLEWAADQLNYGYYGWKYRGWMTLELLDGARFVYAPGLNAATVGLQYFFGLYGSTSTWLQDVDWRGFYRTYYAYFGDPFADAVAPLVAPDLPQPQMTLPFALGETWYFTGGPHGGWGGGSAWAALDFAPPDESPTGWWCYTSDSWVRAVAPGVISRSGGGVVVLDLDGDGDESTGWTVLYLHIASDGRIAAGSTVDIGDPIGRASCEGGVSSATHLHIARRYNGEWIPADCQNCSGFDARPRFKMGDWSVVGLENMEYQGYLVGNSERRVADQGRTNPDNQISW
jgi:LasA protease